MNVLKRFSLVFLLLTCVVLALAGCRKSTPVQNMSSATPLVEPVADREIAAAIVRAGAITGWEIVPAGKGQMIGTIHVRNKHTAEVDITYDQKNYAIKYRSSINLNYKDGKIHPNYNNWVITLDQNIRKEIAKLNK